jgi:hypothetical protein
MTKTEFIQNLEYGDLKNALPNFLNLWNNVSNKINYNTVAPLYYSGTVAGSEFTLYNAGKLYICLECMFTGAAAVFTGVPYVEITDDKNVDQFYPTNGFPYWDATANSQKALLTTMQLKNIYFGRVVSNGYIYMSFNGYRLDV